MGVPKLSVTTDLALGGFGGNVYACFFMWIGDNCDDSLFAVYKVPDFRSGESLVPANGGGAYLRIGGGRDRYLGRMCGFHPMRGERPCRPDMMLYVGKTRRT